MRLHHPKPLALFLCFPAPGMLPLSPCFSPYFMESTDLAWLVNDFYSGYSYLSQLKVEHEEIMLALK